MGSVNKSVKLGTVQRLSVDIDDSPLFIGRVQSSLQLREDTREIPDADITFNLDSPSSPQRVFIEDFSTIKLQTIPQNSQSDLQENALFRYHLENSDNSPTGSNLSNLESLLRKINSPVS